MTPEQIQNAQLLTLQQREEITLSLTTIIAAAPEIGDLGKIKMDNFINFLIDNIPLLSSSPFVTNTGSPLPNPIGKPTAITFVGAGTFTQTTGGSITTIQPLNVLFWSSNGVTGSWVIGVAIPIDITALNARFLALDQQSYIEQAIGFKDVLVAGVGVGMGIGAVAIGEPSLGYGHVQKTQFLSLASTSVTFFTASRVGNVFTIKDQIVKSVGVGVNNIDLALNIEKGWYCGFITSAANVASQVAYTLDNPGNFTSSTVVSGVFTGVATAANVGVQCLFYCQVADVSFKTHSLTLGNVDLIALSGDSYGTGFYQMQGKAWINKASLFSDYNWENYSVSGDTMAAQLNRIRVNGAHFGGNRPWKDYGVVYGIVQLGRNDQVGSVTVADFQKNASALLQTIHGLGAIPILATEWRTVYGASGIILFKAIANRLKALLCNILPYTLSMNYGAPYAPFFALEHPGVRVNNILSESMENFSKKLGRPKKSFKIFRKRIGTTVSTIQDLMFDDNYDRGKLFKEINVGHYAMTDATANWYDNIQTPANYATGVVSSEYLLLRGGSSVSFADYGLIDAILPTVSKNINSLTLTLSDPTIKVYCRDILGTPLQGNGTPQGTWQEIFLVDGVFVINRRVIKRYMDFDKISFLLYKSGGFSITEPKITWVGIEGKPDMPYLDISENNALGAEMLPVTDCGSLTGWTVEGAAIPAIPVDSMLPIGSTGMMVIGSTNKLRQTFTFAADNTHDREIEIKMVCRRFPAIFNPAGDYSTAPITSDTFDYTKGIIEIISGSQAMPYSDKVGLWWKELVFKSVLPLGMTTLDIRFSAETDIEIAFASVKKINI